MTGNESDFDIFVFFTFKLAESLEEEVAVEQQNQVVVVVDHHNIEAVVVEVVDHNPRNLVVVEAVDHIHNQVVVGHHNIVHYTLVVEALVGCSYSFGEGEEIVDYYYHCYSSFVEEEEKYETDSEKNPFE